MKIKSKIKNGKRLVRYTFSYKPQLDLMFFIHLA